MPQYGFIGYGSMGSMLVKELIGSAKVRQEDIIVTRKNTDRLDEIKALWPDIIVTKDITELMKQAKYIFLCMKPKEYLSVLQDIRECITKKHHLISINGSLNISDMEYIVRCKITRLLPTLTSEVKEGITLICHNSFINDQEADELETVFKSFTKLFRVEESDFGFASEFTSCGPGFYAAMLREFVEAGQRHSDCLSKEQILDLVMQTVYGTARLMLDNKMNFDAVINRVATKGGITEVGVKVMEEGLPVVFDEVFDQTMSKRKEVERNLHVQYSDASL